MNEPRRNSRRAFLQGKAAVDAVVDAADALAPAAAATTAGEQCGSAGVKAQQPAADGPTAYLMRLGRRAMACEFEVVLNAGQYPNGAEAAVSALDLIDELEAQLTVYRDTSEVSAINRWAAEREMSVEPRLFALLWQARRLYDETGGAYDITSGPLTKTWGFYRREGRLPDEAEIAAALDRVGSRHMLLDPQRLTVRFQRPGIAINLGSIGKGYALDRTAELMLTAGVKDFFLHGGQSSILARGDEGLCSLGGGRRGWRIGVRHPLRPSESLADIWVRDRAVATSGLGQQFFVHEGRRYGHILDPRTGRPAEGVLSTTVLAPTAAEADALSTAFFVLGVEPALAFCQTRPQLAAVIITSGAKTGSVEVFAAGLAASDWRLLAQAGVSLRQAPIGQFDANDQNIGQSVSRWS